MSTYNWFVNWGGDVYVHFTFGWVRVCLCTLRVKGETPLQFPGIPLSDENGWLLKSEI